MIPMEKTLLFLASTQDTSQLENEINEQNYPTYLHLRGVPKALLPISGRPGLSWSYESLKQYFGNIYIVSNAYNFKHYERWASGINFPRENILNCGISSDALSDIAFVHRVKHIQDDLVITLPELIFTDDSVGIEICRETDSTVFTNWEKMEFAFRLSQKLLQGLDDYQQVGLPITSERKPIRWNDALNQYIQSQACTVSTMVSDTLLSFINPNINLKEYLNKWKNCLDHGLEVPTNYQNKVLRTKAYARVGLMGNPSDGFYGKTMSLLISNFWAEVVLIPNSEVDQPFETITILPNPVSDPRRFDSMGCLVGVSEIDGYETGDRLLQACCKVFYSHCQEHNIRIDTKQGFRMMFETNIPRQVGLAGSSAIITALWKTLMLFYGVTKDQISLEVQASLVLQVEQNELGIAAGLQDRVIQAFGGLVYMDFDREYMEKHDHGKYQSLDVNLLPKLWLAYVADPEDSGKVHSTVKQRFLNGDQRIIQAMQKFASFTDQAYESLHAGDHKRFAQLMSSNFDLRRNTYGDSVVGASNLRMVELARQHHCAAKFPGSGGAIVGMWNGQDASEERRDLLNLRRALESEGYVFIELCPMVY